MKRLTVYAALFSFLLSGCATVTGPSVSAEEIFQARQELEVKSLGFRLQQLEKVKNIGYRLMSGIPQDEIKIAAGPQPFLGMYVSEINRHIRQLFGLKLRDSGAVIAIVLEGSTAKSAGLKAGDVLTSIQNRPIYSIQDFSDFARRMNIGDWVLLGIERQGVPLNVRLEVGSIPTDVLVLMADMQEVNAAASADGVHVTYGLMHFVKSDDEIAAVLAHELAHVVRGHLVRAQVSSLLSLLIALPLGIVAESQAPGAGDVVMRTGDVFKAGYTRDLEREADYFSVRFTHLAGFDPEACVQVQERFAIEIPRSMIRNYLSTHPSSPERMLRMKKAVEELKAAKTLPN